VGDELEMVKNGCGSKKPLVFWAALTESLNEA
jgi:hypothetical protein